MLTLDGGGDPGAVFIFQTDTTLTTAASNSTVTLTGGAQACNVFWQVGSSATLGVSTAFVGNVLAFTSVTVGAGASVVGRVLAMGAAITLGTNLITRSDCDPGSLDIDVPGSANLGSGQSGGTISNQLGAVTVTDTRYPAVADWTASVSCSDFTTGAATPTLTVPATQVDYWSGPATTTPSGSGTFAPGHRARRSCDRPGSG